MIALFAYILIALFCMCMAENSCALELTGTFLQQVTSVIFDGEINNVRKALMMGMSSGTAWSGQVKGLTGLQAVQVKKKMTVDEFVRNNRGINGGEDLPREFLRALYVSIAADEIRISSEAQARPVRLGRSCSRGCRDILHLSLQME